jgi:hypothetical protein
MTMALLVTLSLQGCERHCDLGGVPVHGGSEEQQDAIRAGLRVAEDTLALPICIDHVRMGHIWESKHAEGAYNTVTRGIRLQEEVELETLSRNLRHELCHAVDVQNELLGGHEELFYYPDGYVVPDISERRLVKEAFANTCQVGAEPLVFLWAEDCPGDPDLEGTRLVQREVYGLSPQAPAPGARFVHIASVEVGPDVRSAGLLETESGKLFALLYAQEGNSFESVLLDPWSGDILQGSAEEAADRPLPVPPQAPPRWEAAGSERGGMLTDNVGVVVASWRAWTGEVHRTFAWTDGTFAPVDAPCPNESTWFFTYGTELWSAQVEDGTLSWGRWLPVP